MTALITVFSVMFIALALNRHQTFQTNGFDLGNVNQAVWNTAQGRPLAFTNMAPVQNRLALHVEPILFLLVPFYWVGLGGPEFLIMLQAVSVCLGAWPLYLIAKPKIGMWPSLAVCLAYLLYPALEAAMMFDFHAVTLAPTFLLAAFYWLERSLTQPSLKPSFRWFLLFAALAMACKEDMGLLISMMGLYGALAYRRWQLGLILFVTCFGWSAFAVLGIQNLFGGNVQSGRYDWLFTAIWQPQQIWYHLWLDADIIGYLWGLLIPVAGLALLSPLTLLPTLPSLALNLLSGQGFQWRLEEFHYAAPIAPFIFISTIYGMQRLSGLISQWIRQGQIVIITIISGVVLLSASFTYHYYRGYSPLSRTFQWHIITDHHQAGVEIATRIPAELPLLAPLNLNPHVSSRQYLHQTFDSRTEEDWLWLDVASLPNENGIQQVIRDQLLPKYEVIEAQDGYLLLKPGTFAGNIGPAFHTYAQPGTSVTPAYPVSVFFGNELELVGYDLVFNREEEIRVRTYWKAHATLPADLRIWLYLLDEQSDYLGATDEDHLPATLVWFPPQLWPLNEVMMVDFNSLNWHTRDRQRYKLAVGVTPNLDPWDVVSRRKPQVIESDFAPHLSPDRTIFEVAQIKHIVGMPEGGPVGRTWQQPTHERASEVIFGGKIRLVGYDVPTQEDNQAQDGVSVRLIWQAVDAPKKDYVRFVHVVNRDGAPQLLGQQDSAPSGGTYPPLLWMASEFVAETVQIPLDAQATDISQPYVLHIGFYDPETGQRLLNAQGQDHIRIEVPF
ncbi:MAG: DUF2079 domain-containing protein [Chloroflexota bacterium]